MLNRALAWFRHRSAIKKAVAYFHETNGLAVHSGLSKVIGVSEYGYVVRLCYGDGIPPRRAWFVVVSDELGIAELTFDQAKEFGEKSDR